MKHGRFFPLAALVFSFCLGCAGDRVRIELLEQENRWQCDEIDLLNWQLDEFKMRLDSCRRENSSLKKDLGISDGKSYNPRKDLPSFPGGNAPRKNGGGGLPMVEPGTPVDPNELSKPKSGDSAGLNGGSRVRPVSAGIYSAPNEELPPDQVIDKIVLNKRLTGGHNSDGRPGDDGIMVVFEPQNALGQYVPIAGETSIVLMDTHLDGEASRIARWDFATDEVVTHFRRTLLAKGLNFELRWPNRPPENRDLRLYVRFITAEGKRLIAEKDIKLRFPSDERDARWSKPAEPRDDEDSGADPLDTSPVRGDGRPPRTANPKWQPFR